MKYFSFLKSVVTGVASLVMVYALPLLVNAQTPAPGLSVKLANPLKVGSISELLIAILNIIIYLAIPIVVIFIIFAGFKYVTARGNPGKIQEATNSLMYAIIGGVLIIGAVAIARIIENLVSAFAA